MQHEREYIPTIFPTGERATILNFVEPIMHNVGCVGSVKASEALLRAIGSFSVTFSIISILTGLNTMYGNGLRYGGPMTMIYGFPVVGLLSLAVGLSMAEICSAYPTSGGLYFWNAKLCGNQWGPLASWLTGW
ncbi:hypothetical protein CRG98_014201 [Punica granatum]|uniref:Amino acid permease/ SLC12A domain-containing protein n=1 Tax=Punica granatum TaxID=22663 RepID=A0A2I0KA10_PUNGR|nr:hypothetical protein CRG98_014201 [Punica granatum]